MTYKEAMQLGCDMLECAGVPDTKLDTWYLLEQSAKISREYYFLHIDEQMTIEQETEFRELVKKRSERVPLQYLTGETTFMGLPIKVNPSVLIPRQDTETLVEETLKVLKPEDYVLDMCTGSGCILISLLKLGENVRGMGVDISRQAVNTAMDNARNNGVVAEWECSNLFAKVTERFNVIVSNPPYIPSDVIPELMPEVRDFEPMEALDGTEDGLYFYKQIIGSARGYLLEHGYLIFEIGHDQGEAVKQLMEDESFLEVRVIQDLAHNDRVVMGHL